MKRFFPPLIVAAVTFLTFLPALQNGFVEVDDPTQNLSPGWRGLGVANLRWMFTQQRDYYRPLAWLSHGVDYTLFGLNPWGHHLTSMLIHSASAVLFYFLCRRLLLSVREEHHPFSLEIAATFAALLFSIHPLRVESVAWVAERKDVLATFFFLAAVYCHLRAWTNAMLVMYLCSLLSKPSGIMLPLALIILDVYFLKRSDYRRVLFEKFPMVLVAALPAVISWAGETAPSASPDHPLAGKLAVALFAPAFYMFQTLLPVNLSPMFYGRPDSPLEDPWVVAGALATVALTAVLYRLKNRWAWVSWLFMVTMLIPSSGIVQFGGSTFSMAADRFTYLPGLGWAVLAGGVLLGCLRLPEKTRKEKRRGETVYLSKYFSNPAVVVAVLLMAALSAKTWSYIPVWRDSETLWLRVLARNPNYLIGRHDLASYEQRQGKYAEAIENYEKALALKPWSKDIAVMQVVKGNWGLSYSLAALGRIEEAEAHRQKAREAYDKAVLAEPKTKDAFPKDYWSGLSGFIEERRVEQTVKLNPNDATAHAELAKILSRQGQAEDAAAHFKRAIALNPNLPFCALNFCE